MDKNLSHNLYVDDNRSIIGAKTVIPFCGRYAEISVSVATNRDLRHNESVTQVRFGFRPTNNAIDKVRNIGGQFFTMRVDEFDTSGLIGARRDGMLIFNEPTDDGRYRSVEQVIDYPELGGTIVENSFFRGAADDLPQFIADKLRDKLESVFEHCRGFVSKGISDFAKERAYNRLDDTIGYTRKYINEFVQNVNWAMLFNWTDCGEDMAVAIDAAVRNTTLRLNDFAQQNHAFESFVPYAEPYDNAHINELFAERRAAEMAEWEREQAERNANREKANQTAISMMYDFLGESFGKQFEAKGYVELTQNGYHFTVAPSANIRVADPKGNRAGLCIHTINFSCNPIDEIVIAVLNIQNRFYEFMAKANYFLTDMDFVKPKLKKAS